MAEKRIVDVGVGDRTVKLHVPTETQYMLMGRAAKKARMAHEDQNLEEALYSMVELVDIIEYLIVEPADKAHLVELMRKGELELSEIVDGIVDAAPPPAEKAPTTGPVTRVRRGKVSA